MKKNSIIFLVSILFLVFGCNKNQEARRPISQASGSFMKKSIERNKKLIANEQDLINLIIQKNPNQKYISSKKGFWYTYLQKNTIDSLTPKKGDVAFFSYEIKDLKGKIIYSTAELKPQTYAVDKQNIITGLREAIKLMRKKEKVTFLFPSALAYGYRGDLNKIGSNTPIICTVTLQNFISEIAFKKELQLKETNVENSELTNEDKSFNKENLSKKDSLTN